MPSEPLIGGSPVLTLTAPGTGERSPRLVSAQVLPGRALMLLQLRGVLPGLGEVDLIASPPLDMAAQRLTADAYGNEAFAFGGAVLAPFANRIRNSPTLVANWGGKMPGAARYAMHGLILDRAVKALETTRATALGRIAAGDFGGRWPGSLELSIGWDLSETALRLTVTASNHGGDPTPVGLGWHPYFRLPSGDRTQARVSIPAKNRVIVDNYDEVLPTGAIVPVAGTSYDFNRGRPLGGLYLDDCFCDLEKTASGETVVGIEDPAAGYAIRIVSPSPAVSAVQVYAPPDQPFIVVEPQYNLADPFWEGWMSRHTGMVLLQPGEATTYEVGVELHG